MDYPRPSGHELTGHDDNFDWIELMAQSPTGEIVERAFVQISHVYADLNTRYPETLSPLQAILTGGELQTHRTLQPSTVLGKAD